MRLLLGRVTLADFIIELKKIPTQDIPVRIDDDQYGEQSNIDIEVVNQKDAIPRIIIGWHDPSEKFNEEISTVIHDEEEEED